MGDRQGSKVIIDFLGDFRVICEKALASLGVPVTASDDVVYLYFANIRRRVESRPYRVIEAKELACPADLAVGYAELKAELTQGADVTARLSRTTSDAKFEDMMLNDWGVAHFHLGCRDAQGDVPRTKILLFALVRGDAIYCIGFFDHRSWAKSDIIETVQRNWPALIEHARAKGAFSLEYDVTDEEHENLRAAGIVVLRNIGGDVYGPVGGGYSTARTSMEAHKRADRAQIDIESYEKFVRANVSTILKQVSDTGRMAGTPPCFRFWVNGDGNACAMELTAGANVVLGPFPI